MRTLAAAWCALVSLAGAGCTFAVPERKLEPAVHAQKVVAVTPNQLRLRMRALVGPMTGQIEQAADQIIAATTDDAVKRAALRWKIEVVPALRRALFEADPFAAVIDTRVLFNQMADYFERGPGKEAGLRDDGRLGPKSYGVDGGAVIRFAREGGVTRRSRREGELPWCKVASAE